MIQRVMDGEKLLGSQFETGKALFFFGAAQFAKPKLGERFPNYKFCFLKQVHGNRVVHAEPGQIPEADGHYTGKTGHALTIQTADCVPLMLANDSQVCAIHAGWRGTAAGIVGQSQPFFVDPPEVAVIGPHIRRESFEIGRDVAQTLGAPQFTHPHRDPNKCYYDLSALIKQQLLSHFPEIQIFEVNDNTFTSADYHSFRRGRDGAGRQYSFVVLKP